MHGGRAGQADSVFPFTVRAAITGSTAGKDVIELYVEKPYVNGGLEMAKAELAAFGKTAELKPGASETLTLTVNEQNLCSDDASGDGGYGAYVLPGGEYIFCVASGETGAHIWKSAGDSRRAAFPVTEVIYAGGSKRDSDVVQAANRLQTTDNDTGIASNDDTALWHELSREDGIRAMKTAARHILYACASAALHRKVMITSTGGGWIDTAFIALNVLAYGLAAILLIVFIRKHLHDKKLPAPPLTWWTAGVFAEASAQAKP